MLRRLGIRGKVLAALSVPVLVLFVLAGAVSLQAIDDVQTSRTVTQLLSALDRTRELTAAMQDERAATLAVVTAAPEERADASAELGRVRATTNDAIGAASREAAEIELGALTDRAVTGLRDQLTELDTLRRAVDSGDLTMRLAFTGYTTVVERVTDFPNVVANALDDRELAAIITGQTAVSSLAEKYEQEQVFGNQVLEGAARSGPDLQLLAALFPATDIQQESAVLTVTQLQLGIEVPGLVTGLQTYGNFRSLATSGQENYLSFIDPQQWVETSQGQIDLYAPVVEELSAAEEAQADEVAAAALRTAILTISLTVLAVVVSIAVALTIARQIVNPLRRLTRAAGEVREELPRLVDQVAIPGQGPDLTLAHIPVTSRDEIGQLASAFNDVNSTTIQVAQEQAALRGSIAEMFVNVARRDQVLLNRQLSFIDALERSEEDPKTLADLFRLDHLATRMRRNAESLLVLAGIDTGRRLRETLPTSDVIRTASSEIEHYERVQLDLPVDPTMLGHTALPAAHLLAELLENATVFSDPGTPVQVSTGVDQHHVLVTVLDQGLGMTPEEILDANNKIRTTSAGDVLGAQRLGLFVVGRIANRLGAVVELAQGPSGTGTLATVRFPVSLFVDASSLPPTAPAHTAAALPAAQSPALPAAPAPAQITAPPAAPAAPPAPAAAPEPAWAPVPAGVQDVAPGSLGSAENPAQEVDLNALTDGQTGLGLPRRRSRGADADAPAPSTRREHRDQDDAAAAPSIPLAPQADALAGAAQARAEDAWTPPVVEPAAPLPARRTPVEQPPAPTADLPGRAPVSGLPSRRPALGAEPAPTTGSLPTRQSAAESSGLPGRPASVVPAPLPTRPTAEPGDLPTRRPATAPQSLAPTAQTQQEAPRPDTRAAMFSGFRSRRAELAAAAVSEARNQTPEQQSTEGTGDGAERLAAAAASAASFFGRSSDGPAEEPRAARGAHAAPAETTEQPPAAELAPVEEPTMVIPALVEDEEPAHHGYAAPYGEVEQAEVYAEQEQAAPYAEHEVEHAAPYAEYEQQPEVAEEHAPTEAYAPVHADPTSGTRGHDQQAYQPQRYDGGVDTWTGPQTQVAQQTPAWQPQPAWEPTQAPAPAAAQEQPWAPQAPAAEQAPVWAPQPAAAEQPAFEQAPVDQPVVQHQAPVQQQPAAAPVWSALPAPTGAPVAGPPAPFVDVVDGPSRRDIRGPKKRRGLFGRRRREDQAEQGVPETSSNAASNGAPSYAAPAAAAPSAPVPAPAPVAFAPSQAFEPVAAPSVAPVRQSAWGASESGAHAQQPSGQPVAFAPGEDARPTVPSSPAPAAFEPPPAAPAQQGFGGGGWQPPPAPVSAPPAQAAAPAPQGWAPPPARPSSASAPASTGDVPHPATAPRGFSAQTSFTPEPSTGRAFDDDATSMLAQRADIAQQALAELSQLSAYRPKAVTAQGGSALVRRTPGTIPAAPAIETSKSGPRADRDANQVRSLLSSFQSGTSRGRQAADETTPQSSDGGTRSVGGDDGSADGHGNPVTVPGADLTQRSTSW